MKLFNTLGRKLEELEPLSEREITLYTCGPTVYRYYSIGNLRNAVFNDTLKRTLQAEGYNVRHVMNITDVGHLIGDGDDGEDKLQSQAMQEGKTVWEVAEFYTKHFMDDVAALNIIPPTKYVKATDSLPAQIELITKLLEGGYAYKREQAIYFDVTKLSDYGKLSGQNLNEKETAVRSEVVEDPDKHHPWDFALWFFTVGKFADHQMHWPSPWGEGFPGWHIECSAIIAQEFGPTIDIHTGGVDHIGTHHTNEIAQSEAAHHKPLAKMWLHNEFLLVDGAKMSKSLGNTYRLADVESKGYSPLDLRLLYLQSHYRSQQNFTWASLASSKAFLEKLRGWSELQFQQVAPPLSHEAQAKLIADIQQALRDDLNTPKALSYLATACEQGAPSIELLQKLDELFGLNLSIAQDIDAHTMQLIQEREVARKNANFERSDQIRDELESAGITLEDTPQGARWFRHSPAS